MSRNLILFSVMLVLTLLFASMLASYSVLAQETEAATEAAGAEENLTINLPDAGITPDSVFYGLERALERVRLALTFNRAAKAKLGLAYAEERLSELRLLVEAKKLKAAEKAKEEHSRIMQEVKERINEIEEENATEEAEEKIEIEKRVREQERSIEGVDNEIKVKVRGNLTAKQQTLLDNIIASFKNSTGRVKIEIKSGIGKTELKIKEKTGKSIEEIRERIKGIREEKGLLRLCEERNKLLVKKLENRIEAIEERLDAENLSGINTTALQQTLEQLKEIKEKAEERLEEKEQACEEAEELAEEARDIAEEAAELEEKGTERASEAIAKILERMQEMEAEGVKGINRSNVIAKLTNVRASLLEKAEIKEQIEKVKEREEQIKEKLEELREIKREKLQELKEAKREKAAEALEAARAIKIKEQSSETEATEGEKTIKEAEKPTTQMAQETTEPEKTTATNTETKTETKTKEAEQTTNKETIETTKPRAY